MLLELPIDSPSPSVLELFSKVRLIIADLDGTLLDPKSTIIDLIQSQIPRLRHRRVGFTIATGRALKGVQPILPRLGLTPSMPLALYNGSLVIDARGRKVLHSRIISAEDATKTVRWALHRNLRVLCYPQVSLSNGGLFEPPIGFTSSTTSTEFTEPNGYQISWKGVGDADALPDCLAILIDQRGVANPPGLYEFDPAIYATATRSGPSFIEIRPRGSDKGLAISKIAEHLQIPMSSVLAIGDNDNDIEMLQMAGLAIAVGNAAPNLKAVADYFTPHQAEGGCLQVMRLVIAAHRYSATYR
jgi:hydroxymethylpyrimidine pyrophosphatase-like HAD family hydrolase